MAKHFVDAGDEPGRTMRGDAPSSPSRPGAVVAGRRDRTNGAAVARATRGVASEEMSRLVEYLQQHLGPTTTAYLSGADDLALVERWGEGRAVPDELPGQRLRFAFEATCYLVEAYGDTTARSWFLGTNELLDRESPAWVLRHGQKLEDWTHIIPAARQVVESAR